MPFITQLNPFTYQEEQVWVSDAEAQNNNAANTTNAANTVNTTNTVAVDTDTDTDTDTTTVVQQNQSANGEEENEAIVLGFSHLQDFNKISNLPFKAHLSASKKELLYLLDEDALKKDNNKIVQNLYNEYSIEIMKLNPKPPRWETVGGGDATGKYPMYTTNPGFGDWKKDDVFIDALGQAIYNEQAKKASPGQVFNSIAEFEAFANSLQGKTNVVNYVIAGEDVEKAVEEVEDNTDTENAESDFLMEVTGLSQRSIKELLKDDKIPGFSKEILDILKDPKQLFLTTRENSYDKTGKIIGSRDVTRPNPVLDQLMGQYIDSIETKLSLQKDARDEIFRDEEAVRAFENAQADRNVAKANALTAATGGKSGWEYRHVTDLPDGTPIYEWTRTGLNANETVAHELKLQKIQTQGYENLSDEEVREYEIENALIAATGGIAGGRYIDGEWQGGMTQEQYAAFEAASNMIRTSGGLIGSDQIKRLLDPEYEGSPLDEEALQLQKQLFGSIVGEGFADAVDTRDLTTAELAMVQMAPTLLEAQKLAETLKLAKTEADLDEVMLGEVGRGLTFAQRELLAQVKQQEFALQQAEAELISTVVGQDEAGNDIIRDLTFSQRQELQDLGIQLREADRADRGMTLEEERLTQQNAQMMAQLNLEEAAALQAGQQFDRVQRQAEMEYALQSQRSAQEFDTQEARLQSEFYQLQQLRQAESNRQQQEFEAIYGPEGLRKAELEFAARQQEEIERAALIEEARLAGDQTFAQTRVPIDFTEDKRRFDAQQAALYGGHGDTGLEVQRQQREAQQLAALYGGYGAEGDIGLEIRRQNEAEADRLEQIRRYNQQYGAQYGGIGATGLEVRRQDEAEAARTFAEQQQTADVLEQQRRFNEQLAISQRAQTLDEARAIQDAQQFTQQLAQAQQIQNQQLEQQRRLEAARLAADPRSIAALTTVYGQNVFGAGQALGQTPLTGTNGTTGTAGTTPPAIPTTFSPANYPSPFRTTPFPSQLTAGSALTEGQFAGLTPFARSQYETQKALQGLDPETAAMERRSITAGDIAQAGRIGMLS